MRWTGGPAFRFAFPFRNCGCPVLALFARAGTMPPILWVGYAQRPASHLWCSSPALYHLFLLPEIAFSRFRASPQPLARRPGTDSATLPFGDRRIRRDAETHPPARDGTRSGNAVDGDADAEAAYGPCFVTEGETERPTSARLIRGRNLTACVLASALLRLQCMDDQEAVREAQVICIAIR
jgi:hypothetical protein